jgi:GNAT superfamily N-acetyltransferase
MILVRKAEKKDVGAILQFIRELAEYEKLSDQVVATEAQLADNLFGPRPHAEVLLAEKNGVAVGFCLFFHNFSTFLGKPGIYIEDLYVKPETRGDGAGRALFDAVTALADARKCGRVEWSVLDWNQPAIDFYKKRGAKAMDEWTVFRLTPDRFVAEKPDKAA